MPTTDIDSTFDAAWSRFQALDAPLTAEQTLEGQWAKGRAQYLTFLIRIEEPALRDHIERVQQRIAAIPGVQLFPEDYWHITVKGGGFQVIKKTMPDDILRQDVPALTARARKLFTAAPAFQAQLGLPNGFSEVVFLEVRDGGSTRALNQLVCEQMPELPRQPVDGSTFLPHVSIARFTSNDGLAALKDTLASLRQAPPGPAFSVRRVDLIKVWLSEAMPEFDTLATYPLR